MDGYIPTQEEEYLMGKIEFPIFYDLLVCI